MSLDLPLRIKPGSWIVFEGLDATGKSTQMERLERAAYAPHHGTALFEEPPMFTHQPSGATGIGGEIYKLTEGRSTEMNPLAHQMLHFASHVQHYDRDIFPALVGGQAVFQDRWWWSALAYGYWPHQEFMESYGIHSAADFMRIASMPTRGRRPDVVFLFWEPWADDSHNTPDVVEGYKYLWEQYDGLTHVIKADSPAETTAQIIDALYKRRIITPVARG